MIGIYIDIDGLIKDALSNQDDRARRIINDRYALGSSRRKTLAELGNEYDLTRERVRQIQSAALKMIHGEIKTHKEAIKLLGALEKYLKDVGHIRRGDLMAKDFSEALKNAPDADTLYNKLHFLADALGWPFVAGENEEWYATWYSKQEAYERAKKLVDELLKTKEHDFDKFLSRTTDKFRISEPQIINHLLISKRFSVGPYGHMGADHWIHVNPKNVRDKIFLVLDKYAEPLHFSVIADHVNKLGGKPRATATVHNELIKDPRFVLVGRGTYAIN